MCEGATTEREALDFEELVRHAKKLEVSGLTPKEEKKNIIKVSRLAQELKNYAEENRLRTAKKMSIHADFFEEYFGKNTDIETITSENVKEMRIFLLNRITSRKKTTSERTVNRYYSSLRKAFNVLKNDKKLINYNPCNPNEINPYSEDTNFRDEHIPGEIMAKFTTFFPELQGDIVWLLFNTGLRINCIFRLNISQINIPQRRITVQSYDNKGKRTIFVYMNDDVLALVNKYLPNADYWLFSNPKTGKPFTTIRKSFATAINKIQDELTELGMGGRNITPHDIKRSLGLWMLEQGYSLRVVQELLHHRNIATTARYLGLVGKELIDAYNTLPKR